MTEGLLIPLNGTQPQIHSTAWVAPTAVVIGDVTIGEKSSIWFGTVVRGDVNNITIGKETNIQDNCVIHAEYKKCKTTLGNRITVGHQVILHGCEVKDGSLIGMGAIVMDEAVIGENCLVAAGSLVTEKSVFEDGSLILGRPAKVKRKLTAEEIQGLQTSADHYLMYTSWYTKKGG